MAFLALPFSNDVHRGDELLQHRHRSFLIQPYLLLLLLIFPQEGKGSTSANPKHSTRLVTHTPTHTHTLLDHSLTHGWGATLLFYVYVCTYACVYIFHCYFLSFTERAVNYRHSTSPPPPPVGPYTIAGLRTRVWLCTFARAHTPADSMMV